MTDEHVFSDREHAAERYLLGEMNDADRQRYEEHFFSCAECAEDVRTTAAFLEDVRHHVAPAGASGTRPAQSAAVVAFDRKKPPVSLGSFFWPLPAGAAIAATLLVAVIGYQMFAINGLRRAVADEQDIEAVSSYFVAASRGEGPTIPVSSGQRRIALKFSGTFDASRFYRVEIKDGTGHNAFSKAVAGPASGEEMLISIPANRLADGSYTAVVTPLETATSTTPPLEPSQYQFTVRRGA